MTGSQSILQEREHMRCRLHDTTLQTLELIANGGLRDEPDVRELMRLAAREAAALRVFIEGDDEDGDLAVALRRVVGDATRLADHAIHLELGPLDEPVPAEVVAEIAGAVREALANARKHARARTVVVSAEVDRATVSVSVRDDGVGLPANRATGGFGVRRSIHGRMHRLGGRATVAANADRPGTLVALELELAR